MGISSSQNLSLVEINVIWIDTNIDNEENKFYCKSLGLMDSLIVKLFNNVNEAIEYMKQIKFQETKIIVSGRLYSDLIIKFKENIIDMLFAPKIIVFTSNEKRFIENNEEYKDEENIFYTFGGVATDFQTVKQFIINERKVSFTKILNKSNIFSNYPLSFEYIDNKEKLYLPIFFKFLIDKIPNVNLEQYTKLLNEKYTQKIDKLKLLLDSIKSMANIPIEILSKYYLRLYSSKTSFYNEINKDLRENKTEKYLPLIKILYEAIKLKSFPLAFKYTLYKEAKLSKGEINKMKTYMGIKIKGLPSLVLFSKSFLLFSKEKLIVEERLKNEKIEDNFSKIIFILEKDDNLDNDLSTHADIENISFFPEDKEVLFFPFSSFEIKDIKEISIGDGKGYEVRIIYLAKYLKDFEKDNKIMIENKIPESLFKKQLIESGLINKEIIQNINYKKLFDKYINYNKYNYISGKIYVDSGNINRDYQIINSFENYKKVNVLIDNENDWKYENENEIKENIEIKINGKPINFSYNHKFKNGRYNIKYIFKNNLTKINHLFAGCNCLKNLDFSNFNTNNITNTSYMFYGCQELSNINFSNFNTKNVNDMSYMFYNCRNLTNLTLPFSTENVTNMCYMFYDCINLNNLFLSFNTENVTNMGYMFYNCRSITDLNLSSFYTPKVIDMSEMFNGCRSLQSINLSNFDTKNAIVMISMFYNCIALKKENILTKDSRILQKYGT